MDLAALQRRVSQLTKLDLGPHFEAYRAAGGADTADGFLAYLGTARLVDASVLKELYGLGEIEIPSARDQAFAGTSLAQWAATQLGPGPAAAGPAPARPPNESRVSIVAASERVSSAPTDIGRDTRFVPITKIGEGAMGAVHIARDLFLRRKVALKSVLPAMATHEELVERFLSEMQITAQLEHPNIVPVYALEVGAQGALGYAMKLVQGRDLEQLLEETRAKLESNVPIDAEHSLEKRLDAFLKVCDALEYAHARGIVHRDLKPSNIMIGRHNEVYLMDWGIARPMGAGGKAVDAGLELAKGDPSAPPTQSRTQLGAAIGTPSYMSPEQAAGKNDELDGRSDVYSMGLILQECVSLKRAVDGKTLEELLSKALLARRDVIEVGDRPFQLPREIDAIVRKATQRDPGQRYATIHDLAEDVRRHLRGEPVSVSPEGPVRRAGRWISKHRTTSLVLILALGLVGATGTIGALIDGQTRIAAEHARELRTSQMQTEAAIQAQLVDKELTRYESALTEFVGAAQIVLSKLPGADFAPFYDDLLASKATAPPDFGPSRRYGQDLTILAPLVATAPGVSRDAVDPVARSLSLLAPAFRALMIGTSNAADWHKLNLLEQRNVIADVGVPAFRATVVLREGITLSFPGMRAKATDDPREGAAYKAAAMQRGVVWGKPEGNAEQLLPATAPLYDENGAYRGVATLEISLTQILARDANADLDFVQSRLLVGRDGRLIAEEHKAGPRAPLAPEVSSAIAAGRSGSVIATIAGKTWQYAIYPLTSLDWYYVAASEVDRMKTSVSKGITSDPRKLIQAAASAPMVPVAPASPSTSPSSPPAAATATAADLDAGPASTASPHAGTPGALGGSLHDAGVPPTASASASPHVKGPMPKPAASDFPPNPFERWKVYDKQKGH